MPRGAARPLPIHNRAATTIDGGIVRFSLRFKLELHRLSLIDGLGRRACSHCAVPPWFVFLGTEISLPSSMASLPITVLAAVAGLLDESRAKHTTRSWYTWRQFLSLEHCVVTKICGNGVDKGWGL